MATEDDRNWEGKATEPRPRAATHRRPEYVAPDANLTVSPARANTIEARQQTKVPQTYRSWQRISSSNLTSFSALSLDLRQVTRRTDNKSDQSEESCPSSPRSQAPLLHLKLVLSHQHFT
ncbi:hypothetical protein FZEAL_969 [Fusarium zealandicum]|uniref:Uncharacterized protein n=1 Tax=Fusarium zealandicum TaxID=1053134 RepID=A0A8H4XPT4_9HYPO|nr:hypothetical protein FZEAL_969 [Fusarium zealandicum]